MTKIVVNFADGETVSIASKIGETLLECARRHGLALSADCEVGDCQTCRARVIKGGVEYDPYASISLSEAEMEQGEVLLCVAEAVGDVSIQLPYKREALIVPKPFGFRLTALEWLNDSVVRLTGRVSGLKPLNFLPGQYVNIAIPGSGQTRSYSMANAPGIDTNVEFLIRLRDAGSMSEFLKSKPAPDSLVECVGPYGTFYLRQSDAPILMVAGGTGIAPMASMMRTLAASGSRRQVLLCFGVNSPADLFYLEELTEIGRGLAGFELRIAVAQGDPPAPWRQGYVTDLIIPADVTDADVYLCGPPAMLQQANRLLSENSVDRSRIFAEIFSPTENMSPKTSVAV
ncbi:2Fe-2S iron-sulfur cluster-binding protein [Agrobacterium vitis]|uniref:2Fe-2S iron-sulfur cluster-binding protein n=1 Tax=Agrobacterium vitis TaxID=373 RepID=UPI003D2845B4